MATFPARRRTLEDVVDRIRKQVDHVYVYLNEYNEIPQFFADMHNVTPVLGKDAYGNVSANGKMIFREHEKSGLVFICDDDHVYPDDYVDRMRRILERHENEVTVSVHGSVIDQCASWYYERSTVYGVLQALTDDRPVNLCGSGSTVMSLDHVDLDDFDIAGEVFVDFFVSMASLDQDIPLLVAERDAGWVNILRHYDGLWQDFRGRLTHHTYKMRHTKAWRFQNVRDVWRKHLTKVAAGRDWVEWSKENRLSVDFVESVITGELPLEWRTSAVTLKKALEFLDVNS